MMVRVEPVRVEFSIPVDPGKSLGRSVYCYLVHGDGARLIDSGVKGTEHLLLGRIEAQGQAPGELKAIIHTHAHPDHIGSTRAIKELTGCSVLIHEAEAEWLEKPERQYDQRPVPGFFKLVGGGVRPDRTLVDGDTVDMGKAGQLKAFHTPGHSPGSISLFHEPTGSLFSGDSVSVPGHVPIYDDAVQAHSSIAKLMQIKGVVSLCTAWEPPRSGVHARNALKAGLEVVEKVHELVRSILLTPEMPSDELCRRCISKLGLPVEMANPLTARTFEAHRRALAEGYVELP